MLYHRPKPKRIDIFCFFLEKPNVEVRVLVFFHYIEDSQRKEKGRKKEDIDKKGRGIGIVCFVYRV